MTFARLLPTLVAVAATAGSALAEKAVPRANDLSPGGAESLDPLSPNRFYDVNDMIYSRLVRRDDTGDPRTGAGHQLDLDPEATERTDTPQFGVTFHDGSAFDAADVAYCLGRIEDSALESPVSSVLGIIDRVEAADNLTVKIVLEALHAGLPLLLLDYRVRMIPEGAGPMIEKTPVGTGPFRVDSFDPEGTTTLLAFENYWEGRPLLDRVQFTAIPDSEARNQAMLSGQIDYNSVARDQLALFEWHPAFRLQSFPAGGWFGIVFRTDTPPHARRGRFTCRRRTCCFRRAAPSSPIRKTGGACCPAGSRGSSLWARIASAGIWWMSRNRLTLCWACSRGGWGRPGSRWW